MLAFVRKRREAQIPALVFTVGLFVLLAAWGFQLIGGFVPCKLCLEQRIPYYVGVPLALAALGAALAGAPSRIPRLLLVAAGLLFLFGAYLAAYHAGVEWGWWAGPSDCGAGGAGTTGTTDDLLAQLEGIRIVSCTVASLRILGLSLAGWNALASLGLVVASFYGALRRPSPRQNVPAR